MLEMKSKSNCSTVRLDNNFSGNEIGYITVNHPDGTSEKFRPDGKKVEQ